MTKITQEIAQQIISEFCLGSSSYDLADKYDLWQSSICNLISGRTWIKCQRPENIKEIIKERHEKGHFKKGRADALHQSYPPLTERQMEIMIGSMLGDGHLHKLSKNKPNSYFSKQQCKKNKEYVQWHCEELSPFTKCIHLTFHKTKMVCENGVIAHVPTEKYLGGYIVTTCSHPIFTELRCKWYPKGVKVVPDDLVLTPLSIAIWFCDDGHNNYKNREALICTNSFTVLEVEGLCELFHDFDIHPSIIFQKPEQPIIRVNSKSYDNLIHLISPHISSDCMKYKIKWRRAKKQWEVHGKFTVEQIIEIRELRKIMPAKQIAKHYNINVNNIYDVISGRSYKDVGVN